MIEKPMDVLLQFPIRRNKKQKEAFRADVQSYAEGISYSVSEEKTNYGGYNVIIGDPKTAKYLVTAHYDTPGTIGIPNFITPCNPVVFVLHQVVMILAMLIISVTCGVAIGVAADEAEVAGLSAALVYWFLLAMLRFGPANKNNANDNTSGVVTLLSIAESLPVIHREKVCFVLFDLEEYGLIGSASYRKTHKEETEKQLVLNLDCVGDGDHIVFFPTKKLKKDRRKLNPLYTCCGQFGNKFVTIRDKGFANYPSDQNKFPYGVGIAALRKGKLGLQLSRIHTKKDTILDQTNVNILRSALITYITCTK